MGSFAQGALVEQRTTITTSGGTTVLTSNSVTWQRFDGSASQVIVLPDATTLTLGRSFKITNRSSGVLTVRFDSGTDFTFVASGSERFFSLYGKGTSDGDWSVDAQVDVDIPLNLFASRPSPNSRLNIKANQILTSEGMLLSAPPVNDNLDAIADQYCDFSTGSASSSVVQFEGGAWTTPVSTANFFRRMVLVYVSDASLGTKINTTFSAEAATQGALPAADTLFSTLDGLPIGYIDLQENTGSGGAQYRTPGSSAGIIDNAGIIKFSIGAGTGSGAAGNSAQWNQVDGSAPTKSEENGVEVYLFEAGISQQLVTHLKIPKGHPQSRQIILRAAIYSPSTSGTILLSASTDLIRPDVDSALAPANTHASVNTAIANSGTAYALRIVEIDLTDSVGQISGVNAAAGSILRIELFRGTDTDTEDLRFIPSSTEVVF